MKEKKRIREGRKLIREGKRGKLRSEEKKRREKNRRGEKID